MMKRILASSIVALLLSLTALGAACELSCGFASDRSGCHTQHAQASDSAPTTMKIDNMDMSGMAMPDVADSTDQEMFSSPLQAPPAHADLIDMNVCERQPCDQAQATAGRANPVAATHCGGSWAAAGSSYSNLLASNVHDARDDVAPRGLKIHSPLTISLRI
jgi:hypothetical protein